MKILTFFNEKGGVGKSAFTILYASWLQYKHRVKVAIIDLDNRDENIRKRDLKMLHLSESQDPVDLYPIRTISQNELAKPEFQFIPQQKRTAALIQEIIQKDFKDFDVILIDMPATFSISNMSVFDAEILSLVVTPVNRGYSVLLGTVNTEKILKKLSPKLKRCAFINRVMPGIRTSEYVKLMELLQGIDYAVLPDMVTNSERFSKNFTKDTICSTVFYPDWNSDVYEGGRDLGIENLLIDITRTLNKCPDYMGTDKTDLSFANELEKQFQKKRQLRGSSFPGYEFPAKDFPESESKYFKK